MRAERWREVKEIFQGALERAPNERSAFLSNACGGDEALRHEVESLIAAHQKDDSFIDSAAYEGAGEMLGLDHELKAGQMLGPYRILSALDKGGMGEVYRARDTRLGRDVAIKLLPANLSAHRDRLDRFQQEACAAGALNHPNILSIHDIGTHEAAPYIVSELLEGETLRQRLKGTKLPQGRVIDFASQITQGLAAAHEKGIIHRDLKPENIFITRDGRAKILDFGLAKLTQLDDSQSQSEIPTRRVNTDPGVVLGTVGYMSPEQVRGKPVDHRSDIFSFGAILYEMLSGRRAFRGDSKVETLNAILKEDPTDLSQTNTNVSPALDRIMRHCLEKNPEQRFQSVRDLVFDLETVSGLSGSTAVSFPNRQPTARKHIRQAMTALLLLTMVATLALLFLYFRHRPSETKALRFSIAMPDKTSFAGIASVSPDGRLVALRTSNAAGQFMYFVRPLESPEARPLPGTEGGGFCFWSPDSHWLGFTRENKIMKIDLSGGPPQVVCDMAPTVGGAAWSPTGVILFAGRDGIFSVPASGGTPTLVRSLDAENGEQRIVFPSFLPDGRHFLYLALNTQTGANVAFVGSVDSKDVKRLMNSDMAPAYASPGYLLFVRDGTLLAQPFDLSKLELTAEPVEIARQVTTGTAYSYAPYSVSENGVLVYQSKSPIETQLIWLDRSGNELERVGSPGVISEPVLSPDEKWVAFPRRDNQLKRDLWLVNLERGNASRLTTEGDNTDPVWSPDGKTIAFDRRFGGGRTNVYEKAANGNGEEQLLVEERQNFVDAWSPDGRYILFIRYDPKTQWDEWLVPTFGDRTPKPYVQTPFNEGAGTFSPDGKWVAYYSNESGKLESYIQSFPTLSPKVQISSGGGGEVRWRRDGKELFYIGLDQELMSVEVKVTGNKLTCGVPHPLFKTDVSPLRDMRNHYDVSADGKRFLFAIPTQKSSEAAINVVVNWNASLKR